MNEQSKQKAEGDRRKILTWWENIKKNCLSQNGNSLLGFLRRLHFSELGEEEGSHSLAARSDGSRLPVDWAGWVPASWLPHTWAVLMKAAQKEWWRSIVSSARLQERLLRSPWCDFSSSWRQYSPQKNFRMHKSVELAPNKCMRFGRKSQKLHGTWYFASLFSWEAFS